jgi:hypothetical protein
MLVILIKTTKISDKSCYKYFLSALLILLVQQAVMVIVTLGKFFLDTKPPDPYLTLLGHGLETIFFILFIVASLLFSIPDLKEKIIKGFLLFNLIAFAVIFIPIFFSYTVSYEHEFGMEFMSHWGDLFLESWQLIMIEGLIFIFSLLYLIKKSKVCIMFILALSPLFLSHVGQVLNLTLCTSGFIPVRLVELPLLVLGVILLFFTIKFVSLSEIKITNE